MARILIVEDDRDIALIEKDYLERDGHDVMIQEDGRNVGRVLREGDFNLLLLDLMLPGELDGYDICRMLRKKEKIKIPILMTTALSDCDNRVQGLDQGADDYIVKPFDMHELVARVQANLNFFDRLTTGSGAEKDTAKENSREERAILVNDIRILPKSLKVFKGDKEIKLAHKEFELLKFLAQNPDTIFSKEELIMKIWGDDHESDSATVVVHINRIREKIGDDGKNPHIIETVRKAGYRLISAAR